jgi:hypothetical protein
VLGSVVFVMDADRELFCLQICGVELSTNVKRSGSWVESDAAVSPPDVWMRNKTGYTT